MTTKRQSNTIKIMLSITLANILGKILGFIKDILISYYYGTTSLTDAYFLAMSIPTLILGVFTSSTDSAVIPQYNRIISQRGRGEADDLFSVICNILGAVGIGVSVTILLFPSVFLKIFAPDFASAYVGTACTFLRIFSFCGFLHILYCFFCTYNIIYNRIAARAILAFLTNLILVIAVVICHDKKMIVVSIGFLLGSLLSAILPIAVAHGAGYRYKWGFCCKNPEVGRYFVNFLPIMGTAFLADVNQYIDKFLVSSVEGGLSSLNYAFRLTSIFDSVLIIGVGIVLIPKLSNANLKEDKTEFIDTVCLTIKYLILALIPIVIIGAIFNYEIIEIVYKRGKFEDNAVFLVAQIFICYVPGVVLLPLQTVLAKVFHSREDTKTPLKINICTTLLNIVVSIILFQYLGVPGIALGTTIASMSNCTLLIICIIKEIGWNGKILGSPSLVLFLAGSVLIGYAVYAVKDSIENVFLRFAIGTILSLLLYLCMAAYWMKDDIKRLVRTKNFWENK